MEDDAEGEALARLDAAHPVAHARPEHAALALDRALVDGEDHQLAARGRQRFAERLLARPVLDQQEGAAVEVLGHKFERAEGESGDDAPAGWKKTPIFELERQIAVKRRSHYGG